MALGEKIGQVPREEFTDTWTAEKRCSLIGVFTTRPFIVRQAGDCTGAAIDWCIYYTTLYCTSGGGLYRGGHWLVYLLHDPLLYVRRGTVQGRPLIGVFTTRPFIVRQAGDCTGAAIDWCIYYTTLYRAKCSSGDCTTWPVLCTQRAEGRAGDCTGRPLIDVFTTRPFIGSRVRQVTVQHDLYCVHSGLRAEWGTVQGGHWSPGGGSVH